MFTSCLLARYGRKVMFQIGNLVVIIALLLITIGFFIDSYQGNIMVVIGLFIWMIAAGMFIFPISWLYIAQISQPTFIMIPTMINWLSAFILSSIFPILQNLINAGPIFAFHAVYCIITMIINQKLMIETKDKTQTQIYTEYD